MNVNSNNKDFDEKKTQNKEKIMLGVKRKNIKNKKKVKSGVKRKNLIKFRENEDNKDEINSEENEEKNENKKVKLKNQKILRDIQIK